MRYHFLPFSSKYTLKTIVIIFHVLIAWYIFAEYLIVRVCVVVRECPSARLVPVVMAAKDCRKRVLCLWLSARENNDRAICYYDEAMQFDTSTVMMTVFKSNNISHSE